MKKTKILEIIKANGIIAVIRINDIKNLENIIYCLKNGGVNIIEITLTTPNALEIIKQLSADNDLIIGAGTVLNSADAKEVINAGAEFIVSPILDSGIIKTGHKFDKIVIVGAFSPTEIYQAFESGADAIKIFPAGNLGSDYFKSIKGPFPKIEITPTGGVDINNAAEFIRNGANFIGAGSALLKNDLINAQKWEELTLHIKKFVKVVLDAKQEKN